MEQHTLANQIPREQEKVGFLGTLGFTARGLSWIAAVYITVMAIYYCFDRGVPWLQTLGLIGVIELVAAMVCLIGEGLRWAFQKAEIRLRNLLDSHST